RAAATRRCATSASSWSGKGAEMARRVLDALTARFGDAIQSTSSDYGDEVAVVRRDKLVEVARFLRDDPAMAFNLPCYCTCIDYLGLEVLTVRPTSPLAVPSVPARPVDDRPRFAMVYELRSLVHKHRIRIKVPLDENDLVVPSLSEL